MFYTTAGEVFPFKNLMIKKHHSEKNLSGYFSQTQPNGLKTGFIFVRTIFVQNSICSPFLELTPTLQQMPRDVTNISEDWADFCQCQEFWCHFLSFVFSEKCPFWLWEGTLSLSKSLNFYEKTKLKKWHTNSTSKSLLSPWKYSWRLVAFVKVWEWAREKVTIFHFGQKWCAQKSLL